MGKKGSWFSAIKKVFTSNSKDKPVKEAENKSSKEKKGRGRSKHGGKRSFVPLFREPSSIEKILGEVDQQNLFIGHPPFSQQSEAQPSSARPLSPRVASPRVASPPRATSPPRITSPRRDTAPRAPPPPRITSPPRATSPRTTAPPRITSPKRATSPRAAASARGSSPRVVNQQTEISQRPEPPLQQKHLSAMRIQAVYRGYMTRKNFRALTGLVRLQGVVKGQSVKRQTVNAMKQMQLLVRVQTQIQSRRIQMLENQALKRQANTLDKEVESTLGKNSEMGDEYWDDSSITKEEREARMRRKVEAVIKRERAMAYAYSHQLWKATPKSALNPLIDIRSGGYPWWWNWLERQLPSDSQPVRNHQLATTTWRATPDRKQSPRPQSSSSQKQDKFAVDHLDSSTPMSSRSVAPSKTRKPMTRSGSTAPNLLKYSKTRGGSASPYPMKDDDSLMSCPAFSVPNYMSPTVSAKAKARPMSNPKDRAPGTPGSESSKRRFSFPLTPNSDSNGSFSWKKGGGSSRIPRDMSIDSATSMPVTIGRKAFNRFV